MEGKFFSEFPLDMDLCKAPPRLEINLYIDFRIQQT
jgi:hypothetical protein